MPLTDAADLESRTAPRGREAVAALAATEEEELRALVRSTLGSHAVPTLFVACRALPETHSGKVRALATRSRGLT